MRIKKGEIVSVDLEKTLIVRVDVYKKHPKYHKRHKRSKKYYVHTESVSSFEKGQLIEIVEGRPMSKLKRWYVLDNQVEDKNTK